MTPGCQMSVVERTAPSGARERAEGGPGGTRRANAARRAERFKPYERTPAPRGLTTKQWLAATSPSSSLVTTTVPL